jgi:hypothetical protein
MKKIIFMLLLATGISLSGWATNGGPIKKANHTKATGISLSGWATNGGPIKKANHTKAVYKNQPQKIYRTGYVCISYSCEGFCCDVNGFACGDNTFEVAIYIAAFLASFCPSCSCQP